MKATKSAGPPAKTDATAAAGTLKPEQEEKQDAVALLKQDHRNVEALFVKYEKAEAGEEKSAIAKQICRELIVHTMLEEEIFYPACREEADEEDALDEAQVESDGAKVVIADLMTGSPDDEFYDAKVTVLKEYIKHHVGEEEKPGTGIFAKAQSAGADMVVLGQRISARKTEIMGRAEELPAPMPRALHLNFNQGSMKEDSMNRQSNMRERDDEGRFVSDDDDDRRGSRSRSSRERDERGRYAGDDDYSRGNGGRYGRDRDERGRFASDDDRGNGGRYGRDRDERGRFTSDDDDRGNGGRYGRDRDEQGRFTSDDDDRGNSGRYGRDRDQQGRVMSDDDERRSSGRSRSRSSDYDDDRRSSRSRYDDDDDRRGGGRGQGWSGDSEGHARAAERGWEEREGPSRRSSSRYDDDDDRRSSRGRSSDEEDRRSGGRGHGGWFGDSEGHSEASRRGWEERGGSSSRRSSTRSDADDRRGGDQGHGGWFGDSEGHSEASRRGWRNR